MTDVTVTRTLDEVLETVWARIGDWTNPSWLPGVTLVSTDGPVRVLSVPPDVTLTETLVAKTDSSMTYTTADHPLPITDYRATLSAHQQEGGTLVRWHVAFTP
ncbi:MAG: hypothetical protein ACJATT_003800, partial [Myxococcota bacterium]